MQVSDVMSRDVEVVTRETPIVEAARLMRDADVGAPPVTDGGKLIGMVTDRDIVVRAVADGRAVAEATVGEVMSANLHSCRETDSVEDAATIMAEHQVRRLPVLGENDDLVGIVALADVARRDQDAGGAALDDISEPSSDQSA